MNEQSQYPKLSEITTLYQALVAKRPIGWGSRSVAPYYNEFHGRKMKEAIDLMIETQQDILYRYDSFPDMKPLTIYNRVNQSIRYVLDNMDDGEKTYFMWDRATNKKQIKDLGFKISYKPEMKDGVDRFNPDCITPERDLPNWRRDLNNFLESDDHRPFMKENMSLTLQQVKDLRVELAGMKSVFTSVVSSSSLIVFKKEQ